MATSKIEYRDRFLTLRNGLSPRQRSRSSARILRQVFDQPAWKKAEVVLAYVATGSEVETRPLIEEALQAGKRVALPVIAAQGFEPLLVELKQLADLRPGPKHGIPEPAAKDRQVIEPAAIDLAIVPGIAFDDFGGRLGFGSGYFDRLLPLLTKAVLWGLAFGTQLSEHPLPMEPHDHPVHAVITEDEIIYPEEVG